MSPWLSVVLFGVAVFGFSWLMPKRGQGEDRAGIVGEAAYDRLLEDLEMENRELVDAVAKFKDEQDETVRRLGNRIVEMERQMKLWTDQQFSAPAVPSLQTASSAGSPAAPVTVEASAIPAASVEVPEAPAPAAEEQAGVEETDVPSTSIRVRYAELIAMHDKGRSVEQIAKAAGMNKGEVQLILQLARREEEQLA
ncbi:hypothetical protein E5161_04495 [Cohnella pontilimi]|uniref:DUF2802 domain-containing protein n=1 Tax=Cohnella pontilimi TaxID=2564100 RepID=A0A4U0FFL4_9BACL|nr:hypothetical protein [Cohnella pontilimi]TJY43164.1 hypothetical protein E5161_04495 [Cohnella pontilimi]